MNREAMNPEAMNREAADREAADTPLTTADGSKTLYSARYGQAFASQRGALSEAQHVFLVGSGVAARLAGGARARVLEVGFGAGLNFFTTARACAAQPGAALSYTALERELLGAGALAGLGYGAHAGPVVAAFLGWRRRLPERVPAGCYRFVWGHVRLELWVGEACAQPLPAGVDAVYQDAFSPSANPELWTGAFLARLAQALRPGGTLVSYCVQGAVRRRLAALGLTVTRQPGPPGGKREVLRARKL